LSKNVSNGQRKFLDGRRLSFTEIMARRSFSKFTIIKPLDLEAIDLLLSSVNMTKGSSLDYLLPLQAIEFKTLQARQIEQRQLKSNDQ